MEESPCYACPLCGQALQCNSSYGRCIEYREWAKKNPEAAKRFIEEVDSKTNR